MPLPVRFRMDPRNDLSTRTDFSFDFMNEISKAAKEIVQEAKSLDALRDRADIRVIPTATLINVTLEVEVTPREEGSLTEEEIKKAKADVMEELRNRLNVVMGELLQNALTSARRRM